MVVLGALFAIILNLFLVVGLHEAGHAWAAQFFNVQIKRISIGFGRPLFCWTKKNGCELVWSLWPFGGYVELLNTRIKPVANNDLAICFDKKPVGVRCLILLAGAGVNVLTAWVALVMLLMIGYQQTIPVIKTITTPSIAATAGLAPGDRIISVAGHPTASWRDVGMILIMTFGKDTVDVGVQHAQGRLGHLQFDLTKGRYHTKPNSLFQMIGINPEVSAPQIEQVQGSCFLLACEHATHQLLGLILFFIVMLKQLATGALPFSLLLGPFGLLTSMVHSFFQGLGVFLYFITTLSLSVGLTNLLPIPGLDGGSIVYALIEKVRGKPVSVAMEVLLHRLMLIVLCIFVVHLLMNDLQHYIQ